MKVLTRLLPFILLTIFVACSSNDALIINEYNGDFITFGNGGGFTGAVSKFYLFPDGKVYRNQANSDTLLYIGRISDSIAAQQFQNFDALRLGAEKIDDPGNMYFFLGNNKNDRNITWGGTTHKVPDHVTTFYNNLNRLVKQFDHQKQKK